MNNKLSLSLLLLTLSGTLITRADNFGEGFGVGAVTGLVGGIITSKIAAANTPPAVYVYEDPFVEEKRRDLFLQEQELRAARLEQRRRERELVLKEQAERYAQEEALREQARRRARKKMRNAQQITIVETKTVARPKDLELRERELALKEQEVKLALIKEENRKKELLLKEKELELQLQAQKPHRNNGNIEETIVTKKISKY